MKKNGRRRLTVFIAVWLFLWLTVVILSGTSAYLTDHGEIINRITAGYNETETEEEFPDPDPVSPGEMVVKKVRVRNQGPVPRYIRISLAVSQGNVVLEGLDTENWIQEDEFYYYRHVVNPGDSTSELFEGVIPENCKEAESITVTVMEESVQACDAGVPYRNYREAWKHYRGGGES